MPCSLRVLDNWQCLALPLFRTASCRSQFVCARCHKVWWILLHSIHISHTYFSYIILIHFSFLFLTPYRLCVSRHLTKFGTAIFRHSLVPEPIGVCRVSENLCIFCRMMSYMLLTPCMLCASWQCVNVNVSMCRILCVSDTWQCVNVPMCQCVDVSICECVNVSNGVSETHNIPVRNTQYTCQTRHIDTLIYSKRTL